MNLVDIYMQREVIPIQNEIISIFNRKDRSYGDFNKTCWVLNIKPAVMDRVLSREIHDYKTLLKIRKVLQSNLSQ